MDEQQETRNTWNNIAGLYNEKFKDLRLYDESYDYICQALMQTGAKILDVGCGPGNITQYLLSKRPDFDIFGIDLAENMIELAQRNNPTARFEVMDSRQMDRLDTKFDGIVAGFCLPYLSPMEAGELISSAHQLLNEQGLLYLSFVEGEPEQSGFKVGSGGRVYFYFHELDTLLAALKQHHFSAVEIFKVPYKVSETQRDAHTIVLARKK